MARDALVVGIERDQLRAERAPIGRHEPQEALVLGDREHHAPGLNDLAARQVVHRLRHGRNQLLHAEQIADGSLVEDHFRPNQCLSSMLCPSGSRISARAYSPSRTLGPHVIGTFFVFR